MEESSNELSSTTHTEECVEVITEPVIQSEIKSTSDFMEFSNEVIVILSPDNVGKFEEQVSTPDTETNSTPFVPEPGSDTFSYSISNVTESVDAQEQSLTNQILNVINMDQPLNIQINGPNNQIISGANIDRYLQEVANGAVIESRCNVNMDELIHLEGYKQSNSSDNILRYTLTRSSKPIKSPRPENINAVENAELPSGDEHQVSFDDSLSLTDILYSGEKDIADDLSDDRDFFKFDVNPHLRLNPPVLEDGCVVVHHNTPHGSKRNLDENSDDINDTSAKRIKWDIDCNENCTYGDSEIPLPSLIWADRRSMWNFMMHKTAAANRYRSCSLFFDTNSILPRMRAILVEWIMEVCEVYRLRRTTYYLAVDYIDRYLTINPNVPKARLQLLGITCLYIAAKYDEVLTPCVGEFSYVCDGACEEAEILRCEKLLLNTFSWDLNPMTPTIWLSLFMQIYSDELNHGTTRAMRDNDKFMFPQYSALDFSKASHLMDLFSLDPCYLLYGYNVIAAAAVFFLYGRPCALRVSGLQWSDIHSCVEYMAVFHTVISNSIDQKLEGVPSYPYFDRRDILIYHLLKCRTPIPVAGEHQAFQSRTVTLDLLEKACLIRIQQLGFHVTKKEVTKKYDVTVPSTSKTEEVVTEKKETDQETKEFLFELERKTAPNSNSNKRGSDGFSNPENDDSSEYFECKSELTFDEILEGINDCTIKKIVPEISLVHPQALL